MYRTLLGLLFLCAGICVQQNRASGGYIVAMGDTTPVLYLPNYFGNQANGAFFKNILGDGTRVATTPPNGTLGGTVHGYFASLPGVISDSPTRPLRHLLDTDLLVVVATRMYFTADEVAPIRDM